MTAPTAIVSADARTVTLASGEWSATIPAADLPKWIRLYRGLAARPHPRTAEPAAFAAHYQPALRAMERAQRLIDIMTDSRE